MHIHTTLSRHHHLGSSLLATPPFLITCPLPHPLQVLPGGHVSSHRHGMDLLHLQEVLGDKDGAFTASLPCLHFELCGKLSMAATIPYIRHHGKRVLTATRMEEGDVIELHEGGHLAYPVNFSTPRCGGCPFAGKCDDEQ